MIETELQKEIRLKKEFYLSLNEIDRRIFELEITSKHYVFHYLLEEIEKEVKDVKQNKLGDLDGE